MPSRPFDRRRAPALVLAACLALASACGGSDKVAGPSRADVAGNYRATTLTARLGPTTTDLLAQGGSLTIALRQDGSAGGHLFIPASVAGTSVDQSLNGTWTLEGNRVRLKDGSSSTALGDLALTVSGTTLTGDETISGVTVHVVMTRLH